MPAQLRYSTDHEWVRDEGDGVAVVGVTDFAAGQLGDVVYLELPEVGDDVTAGTEMGEIESTKSVSELVSPVTGTVLELNQEAVDAPELVNGAPFAEGWLLKVRVDEIPDDLLDAEQYAALVAS